MAKNPLDLTQKEFLELLGSEDDYKGLRQVAKNINQSRGVNRSHPKWIKFLTSDDKKPGHLYKKLLKVFNEHKASLGQDEDQPVSNVEFDSPRRLDGQFQERFETFPGEEKIPTTPPTIKKKIEVKAPEKQPITPVRSVRQYIRERPGLNADAILEHLRTIPQLLSQTASGDPLNINLSPSQFGSILRNIQQLDKASLNERKVNNNPDKIRSEFFQNEFKDVVIDINDAIGSSEFPNQGAINREMTEFMKNKILRELKTSGKVVGAFVSISSFVSSLVKSGKIKGEHATKVREYLNNKVPTPKGHFSPKKQPELKKARENPTSQSEQRPREPVNSASGINQPEQPEEPKKIEFKTETPDTTKLPDVPPEQQNNITPETKTKAVEANITRTETEQTDPELSQQTNLQIHQFRPEIQSLKGRAFDLLNTQEAIETEEVLEHDFKTQQHQDKLKTTDLVATESDERHIDFAKQDRINPLQDDNVFFDKVKHKNNDIHRTHDVHMTAESRLNDPWYPRTNKYNTTSKHKITEQHNNTDIYANTTTTTKSANNDQNIRDRKLKNIDEQVQFMAIYKAARDEFRKIRLESKPYPMYRTNQDHQPMKPIFTPHDDYMFSNNFQRGTDFDFYNSNRIYHSDIHPQHWRRM